MRIFTVLLVLLGYVTGTGCGTNSRDPAEPPDSASATPHLPTPQPDPSPEEVTTPMSPTPATAILQNLITAATEDLSRRLSIPATEITMVEAKAVTWSDSSLGCPVEGMMYAQVLTPGFLVVLEHAGSLYEYHAGRGPDILYCESPLPPVPGMPDNT